MDPNQAILFGQILQEAYAVLPADTTPPTPGSVVLNYDVIAKLYGNDLATDINPARGLDVVSFGYVLQNATGDLVVAIRGTEGIFEWLHDGMFLLVPNPIPKGLGFTEDGFTAIYKSMTMDIAGDAERLAVALGSFAFPVAATSITICGHSLGGALATFLAFDLQLNHSTAFKNNIAVYTYASPHAGDPVFATAFNHVMQNSYRIANRMDIVPKLPFPPFYEHVLQFVDLDPKMAVTSDIACNHSLNTYLYMLSLLPNATTPITLATACALRPVAVGTPVMAAVGAKGGVAAGGNIRPKATTP